MPKNYVGYKKTKWPIWKEDGQVVHLVRIWKVLLKRGSSNALDHGGLTVALIRLTTNYY